MATEPQSPDTDRDQGQQRDKKIGLDRDDEEQDFVDQSTIDFDPDEGLYSGTAVDGSSEIPGPHLDGETGELSQDDIQRQAEDEAGDVDPAETPAAKSSVAKAAERDAEKQSEDSDESSEPDESE
jgi:hypothetical protein